jgi:farnesyl-diphosphate farnesyltransferase
LSAKLDGFDPEPMNASLRNLLKPTSRSFYLTLRVLPRAVRPQIGLAYLLARTTDTIADTEIVPAAKRLQALQHLRDRILGQGNSALDFTELARHQGLPAERSLLDRCDGSLALLRDLSPADLQRVRKVLQTIISGQQLDLQRFADASAATLFALHNEAELDDYTYRVAGCVGEFWTTLCRAHLFPGEILNDTELLAQGVRFGKGLQLVNILRDLPADLRKGRCYLPADKLAAIGLQPLDLLQTGNESRFRPLYEHYLDLAEANLAAGWAYTNTLPRSQVRVRLGCAWPVLIGLETIRRLRTASVLDPNGRVKIRRSDVRRIVLRSVLRYPCPNAWRQLSPMPA